MSSIDHIYNRNSMEYEDLYTKMSNLVIEHTSDLTAIKRLKGEIKASQDKLRREKMKTNDHLAKMEISKKHIEQFRNENAMLENKLKSKNEDISILEKKCKILEIDKDELRRDFLSLKTKVEVVVESASEVSSEVGRCSEKELSDDSVEIINAKEKKIQTASCLHKNKGCQTDYSKLFENERKGRNRYKANSHLTNSCKSVASYETDILQRSYAPKEFNLDLLTPEKQVNVHYLTGSMVKSRVSQKRFTQQLESFLQPKADSRSPDRVLPELRVMSRGYSKDMACAVRTPRQKGSDQSLQSPSGTHGFNETREEKLNKLASIYTDSRKSGFLHKVQTDSETSHKMTSGKSSLKNIMKSKFASPR